MNIIDIMVYCKIYNLTLHITPELTYSITDVRDRLVLSSTTIKEVVKYVKGF